MARITMVDHSKVTFMQKKRVNVSSGGQMKNITIYLNDGGKISLWESDALFPRIAPYIKQGDEMSFKADVVVGSYEKAGETKESIEYKNLSDVVITPGLWSEEPLEGLEGRSKSATEDDEYIVQKPKDAPPPASRSFTAPKAGEETTTTTTATDDKGGLDKF